MTDPISKLTKLWTNSDFRPIGWGLAVYEAILFVHSRAAQAAKDLHARLDDAQARLTALESRTSFRDLVNRAGPVPTTGLASAEAAPSPELPAALRDRIEAFADANAGSPDDRARFWTPSRVCAFVTEELPRRPAPVSIDAKALLQQMQEGNMVRSWIEVSDIERALAAVAGEQGNSSNSSNSSPKPVATVVSEGPPDRSLKDILANPPTLHLEHPDPLHPCGRCTCAGEGRCEWCKSICEACGGDGRAKPAAPVDPACPSEECPMCNGEACDKCGAGCWDNGRDDCEHDVVDRHEAPAPAAATAPVAGEWRADGLTVVDEGGFGLADAVDAHGARVIADEHNSIVRANRAAIAALRAQISAPAPDGGEVRWVPGEWAWQNENGQWQCWYRDPDDRCVYSAIMGTREEAIEAANENGIPMRPAFGGGGNG